MQTLFNHSDDRLVNTDQLSSHIATILINRSSYLTPSVNMIAELATATLFVAFLIVAFLYVKVQHSKHVKFLDTLPSPPKWPILGSALELNVSNEEMTRRGVIEWPRKYGPRFGIQLGPSCYFSSLKTGDLEKLLSSPKYIQKGYEYKFAENWIGQGLLTSSGAKWFHRRKLLTPSFHFKILDEFFHVFNAQAKLLVDTLKEDGAKGMRVLEICQYVTRCTLDIICETAMGKKIDAQLIKDSPYIRAIAGISTVMQYRAVRPWLRPDFMWNLTRSAAKERKYLKVIHGFTESVIKERRAQLLREGTLYSKKVPEEEDGFISKKKQAAAFMDLLLRHQADNPGEITDLDIREETDTFMFEGHDTTAASLSWTIHLLGANPENQEKVYQELKGIFGDDLDRAVTNQDICQMKYLECCIKESLRLFPSVPLIDRQLTEDLPLDDRVTVPQGCSFVVFIFAVHRDPKVYPDPEAFIPERFFPENAAGRHPYAYLPFSAGPRNCIGQKFALLEEKVILSQLLRKFRIESMDKREDIVLMSEMILRPRDGLRVKLHPRE